MGQRPPSHASTDHDLLFRLHRWLANLRVLEMEEIKSVPYAPVRRTANRNKSGASTLLGYFSGTPSTWPASWTNSGITTMRIVSTARWHHARATRRRIRTRSGLA
jgi:hypothetical protein